MIDNGVWESQCEIEADCNYDGLDCAGYVYVEGGSVQDGTPREGSFTDPHRSLTGTLASLSGKVTIIKLLDSVHYLNNFD